MALLGQFRRDTLENWSTINPMLADGEFIIVRDNTNTYTIGYKTGNGYSRFNDLGYNSNVTFLNELGDNEQAGISQKFTGQIINDYNISNLHTNEIAADPAFGTNKFTLSQAIAVIPASVLKQGLVITFISSETNEWKRYQNVGTPFTTLQNWEDLASSVNVIQPPGDLDVNDYLYNIYYAPITGKVTYEPSRLTTDFIQVDNGQIIDYTIYGYTSSIAIAAFDANQNIILNKCVITSSLTGETGRYIVDSDNIRFLRFTRLNNVTGLNQAVSFYKPDYLPNIEESTKGIRQFSESDFIVEGMYINPVTGKDVANANWNATDFIPVVGGELIFNKNLYGTTGGAVIAFYDGAKVPVELIRGNTAYDANFVSVPEGALYVRFSMATGMPITIKIINGTNRTQMLSEDKGEIIVDGFDKFYVTGTWSRSGKDLTVTGGSFTQARYDTPTFEDEFVMSCRVRSTVATGGGFETGIGKTSPTAGYVDRWIMMCKDSTGSYLKSYYRPNGSFAEQTGVRQKLATELVLNKWYVLQLIKTTDEKSAITGRLYDEETGELLASFRTTAAPYAWGYPVAINRTGQAQFSGFVMSYPKKSYPLVAVYGDSFIEGNSIEATKNLRYSALLQSVLGKYQCLLFGHGGATSLSDDSRTLLQIEKVNSAYAIIAYGDNDVDFNTWYKYVAYMIQMCELTNTLPVFVTVCPRVSQSTAYITKMQAINNWIRTSGYPYIDANEACTSDGLTWKTGYVLDDGQHPSVLGHQAIFNKIKSDCGFLVENAEFYEKAIIEEKFSDIGFQLKDNDLLTQCLASSFKATPISVNLLDTDNVLKGWAYNEGVWENNPDYISSGKLYMDTAYYTIQNVRAYPTNLNVYIAQFDVFGNHLGRTVVTYASEDNLKLTFKYNKPEGVAYERIVLSVSGVLDASDMQLERGLVASTPVAFQGWLFDKNEQDFISKAIMGYNEYPIGKNYIDENNLLYGYSLQNGLWISVNRGIASNRLFLKDGTTYTVSNLAVFSPTITNMYLAYFDKDGNFLKRTAHAMVVDSTGLKGSCTFTANVDDGQTFYVRMVLQSSNVNVNYVPNPQLEVGSAATAYEAYAGTKYVLEVKGSKSSEEKNVLLTGASFAFPDNEWFRYVCDDLGITGYNKAVSGETMQHTAQKMHDGTLYTQEEFEDFDIFLIFHSHNQTVTDTTNLKENYEDYVFPLTDRSAQWDYVLKKYAAECYAARLNTNSRWYGTKDGKPYRVVVVTHWHDARTIFNNSIRELQAKWGFTLCELDKRIGFSKNEVHPVTGAQVSILHCDNPSNNTEIIDGVEYGWHPTRNKGAWIQHRMADIIGDTLVTCEASTRDSDLVKSLEASDSLSGGSSDFISNNIADLLPISTSEVSIPIVDYDNRLGISVSQLWMTVQEGRYYHIFGNIETFVPMSIVTGWSGPPSEATFVTNYNSWKPAGKHNIDIIIKAESVRMAVPKGLTVNRITPNLITTKTQTRSAISNLNTPTVDMTTTNRRGPNSLVPAGSTIISFSFIPKQAGTSLMEVWKLENGVLTVIDSLDIVATGTTETPITAYIGKTVEYDTLFTFVNKTGVTGCIGMLNSSTTNSTVGQFSIPVASGNQVAFTDITSTFGALAARIIYTIPVNNDVKDVGNLGALEVGAYKQFTTIQSAVNTARDGDTIIVYPGVYNERVQAWGKNINLVGISRETCILRDDSSDYRTPPLEMNVGSVQNMTIIETANNPDPAIDGVILPEGWPAKDMAYTIHAESAVNSYGRSLKVIGCRLVNANRPCIGAGTYNNYSIELIDTELYSGVGVYEEYKRGTVYVHAKADGAGTSQALKMIRCDIYCEDKLAITLRGYTVNSVKNFDITAINCNVYSAINGREDVIVDNNFGVESGMSLNDRSFGNNINILNKI